MGRKPLLIIMPIETKILNAKDFTTGEKFLTKNISEDVSIQGDLAIGSAENQKQLFLNGEDITLLSTKVESVDQAVIDANNAKLNAEAAEDSSLDAAYSSAEGANLSADGASSAAGFAEDARTNGADAAKDYCAAYNVMVTEAEYQNLVDEGKVEPDKFYHFYVSTDTSTNS